MSIKNNLDPRVIRTRQLLQDALISLMEEADFESITVQDISKKANVNRATFYSHYEDKYSMIRQIVLEKLKAVEKAINDVQFEEEDYQTKIDEIAYQSFLHLFEHIEENAYFYKVLLRRKGTNLFRMKLHTILEENFLKGISFLQPNERNFLVPAELLSNFITGATISVITYWLEKDMLYTPKFLAEKMLKISKDGTLVSLGVDQ